MRTMYDAVTPSNVPTSAQMVAGYVDGAYAWSAAGWARFPGAVKVRIAVFSSTNDGHVLDVEPGCSTPASAPGWVQRRRAAGVDPSVYCNTSTWPTVRAAFRAAGVAEPHYWIAAYPGIGPNLYPGSVAHQYADPGPVDLSVVADYWPGVDNASGGGPGGIVQGGVVIPGTPTFPTPTPSAPAPAIQEDDDMILIKSPGRQPALIGPGYSKGLTSQVAIDVAAAMASKILDLNDQQWDEALSVATSGNLIPSVGETSDPQALADAIAKIIPDSMAQRVVDLLGAALTRKA